MSKDYELWYKQANKVCIEISGVGIDDLPDGNSRDAFESGSSPREYVLERLEEDGFPFDAFE